MFEFLKRWLRIRQKKQASKGSRTRKRNQVWIAQYKATCFCIKCRENHPACLEFHHRDKAKKTATVSSGVRKGWSIRKLQKEIDKCDVLCANCHRKHHYMEGKI